MRAHVAQEVVSEAQRYARSQSYRGRRGRLPLWQAWAYKLVYISPFSFRYLGVEYLFQLTYEKQIQHCLVYSR